MPLARDASPQGALVGQAAGQRGRLCFAGEAKMKRGAAGLIVTLALGLLVSFPAVAAQETRNVPRIGFLVFVSSETRYRGFQQGLRELGYREGENIVIEFRSADGSLERLSALADELVRLRVDVIVAGSTPGAKAAQRATSTIPIVIPNVGDPVGSGLVASLAKPGGNITGLTTMSEELSGKRLELLREVVPRLRRLGALWDQDNPGNPLGLKQLKAAAESLGVDVRSLAVRPPVPEIDKAFETAKNWQADALIVSDDSLLFSNRTRIIALAARYQLPAMYGYRELPDAGGLLAYGPSRYDMYRRAATYVDKILKGAKPADLPVEQPTKFEFVINLKTAKALGLTIPQSVLVRADEVIR
jgi:putative ABC transport system substrate-binding protein